MITHLARFLILLAFVFILASSPSVLAQAATPLAVKKQSSYTNQEVMAKLLKLRKNGEVEAALQLLSDELDQRAVEEPQFASLYRMVWREAQVRTGRLDPDWSARLYDQLFMSCHKHHLFGEMYDVMGNLLSTLGSAGRHGRKTEVLEWWAAEKAEGGKVLELTKYPDLGPALACLPQVRNRSIPEEVLFARAQGKVNPRSNKVHLGQVNAHMFIMYAGHLGKSGQWREALEWECQIRNWSSLENGSPKWQLIQPWFSSVESIAGWLQWHGFHEEALGQLDAGLAAPMQESYHGRCNITMSLRRLVTLMDLDRAPDDLVEQARKLAKRAEKNVHLSVGSHLSAKLVVAKALLHQGADAEALELLEELAGKGFTSARNRRLQYWIDHGVLERVEEELLLLLKASRESGHKYSECWLYEKYADYLEATGRFAEALSMRREVIRLYKSFDHFTKIPIQLAKLALLLERMGDVIGAKAAAAEARGLLAKGGLPKSRADLAKVVLAKLNMGNAVAAEEDEKDPQVDFQPEQSIVIPIEGAGWTTLLTLANPSSKAEEGTLTSRGIPMVFNREGEDGNIVLRPQSDDQQGEKELRLRLEPSTYELIRIVADPTFTKEGELSLVWDALKGEPQVEAKVQIEAPEKGVSSSIIQAGSYRANPFYGVPVYFHYVSRDKARESLPLRFMASQQARVEVYAMDGTPLSVDGQGNGSLRDRGDELFGKSDGDGNLMLPLEDGAASFMVLIYPDGPLPEDGLNLNVEVHEDGAWLLNSQNRLVP